MATYTIGQLADRAGVNLETVRYYERKGLLREPPRTDAGYRQYGPDALARLEFIARAKQLGFTLAEIAGLLEEHDAGGTTEGVLLVAREKIQALEEQQRELAATRSRLELLVAVCTDPDSAECLDLRVGGCRAAPQEAVLQGAAPQEAAPQEAVQQGAAPREAVQQEAGQ